MKIAVSSNEVTKWGCPYCGFRSSSTNMSCGGAASCKCGDCGKFFIVLAEGITKSPIGIKTEEKDVFIYPELSKHPRWGTLKHSNLDKRAKNGNEFFRSRGICLDKCYCFVCGTNKRSKKGTCFLNNIAAFVQCKEAGERIISMFKQGTWLDYREYEPDCVQVKIGACDEHLSNLRYLKRLTEEADNTISKEMIAKAINFISL
jgi:hypothetical protein